MECHKGTSIASLILGIIGIIVDWTLWKHTGFQYINRYGNIIGGLFLIITGIHSFNFSGKGAGRWSGILGIILGIIYLIIGIYP